MDDQDDIQALLERLEDAKPSKNFTKPVPEEVAVAASSLVTYEMTHNDYAVVTLPLTHHDGELVNVYVQKREGGWHVTDGGVGYAKVQVAARASQHLHHFVSESAKKYGVKYTKSSGKIKLDGVRVNELQLAMTLVGNACLDAVSGFSHFKKVREDAPFHVQVHDDVNKLYPNQFRHKTFGLVNQYLNR